MSNHELYNAGHFLECVVAYTRYKEGIKKPDYRLFEAGKRFADLIVRLFGPEAHYMKFLVMKKLSLLLSNLENFVKNMKVKIQVKNTSSQQRRLLTDEVKIVRYERAVIMEMSIHKIRRDFLMKQMLLVILYEPIISMKESRTSQQFSLKKWKIKTVCSCI